MLMRMERLGENGKEKKKEDGPTPRVNSYQRGLDPT